MKRRSFLKGLLFSAMMPIAMAVGVGRIEARIAEPLPTAHKIVWVLKAEDLPDPINGLIQLEENTTYKIARPVYGSFVFPDKNGCEWRGHTGTITTNYEESIKNLFPHAVTK